MEEEYSPWDDYDPDYENGYELEDERYQFHQIDPATFSTMLKILKFVPEPEEVWSFGYGGLTLYFSNGSESLGLHIWEEILTLTECVCGVEPHNLEVAFDEAIQIIKWLFDGNKGEIERFANEHDKR